METAKFLTFKMGITHSNSFMEKTPVRRRRVPQEQSLSKPRSPVSRERQGASEPRPGQNRCAIAARGGSHYHGKRPVAQSQNVRFTLERRRFAMKRWIAGLITFAVCALPMAAADDSKETDRLQNAGMVLQEILNVPDDIPQDLLHKAECVIVYPSVLKAAFVVGGSYGRGAMSCRTGENFTGPWSAPAMMALEAGSFGFQIGGQATDFVLLVMNDRGARAILSSKVKLGGDAAVAAGPKGRNASASTDVTLRAEVLSYSRSRGLFAGISLEGSTVRPDNDANERLYGKKVSAQDIIFKGVVRTPPSGQRLVAALNRHAGKAKAAKE